ncbi:MAG: hypothetical protein C0501_17545 [Isosphaera sp.]|nr:hypothetical protein [Isosphaera sp.]
MSVNVINRAAGADGAADAFAVWAARARALLEELRGDLYRLAGAAADPGHPLRGLLDPDALLGVAEALIAPGDQLVDASLIGFPPALPDPLRVEAVPRPRGGRPAGRKRLAAVRRATAAHYAAMQEAGRG